MCASLKTRLVGCMERCTAVRRSTRSSDRPRASSASTSTAARGPTSRVEISWWRGCRRCSLSRELGATIDIHGHRLYCFPGPDALIQLRSFRGLFGRKVDYLNELGRAALAGHLDTETLRSMKSEDALASLKRLKGIGEFGSQLVRLRALSAVDELPTAEPRLLGAVRTAYGLSREPDVAKLEELAEKWRPYRMWVAVCLRRTLAGGAGMMHSRAAG
ncbi:MAG: hypothetical protein E6I29_11500 [Chloroflexi bacterium]|nr:MAG: hypothetical protein E6I29_11500 [Chloroflexota bacterium]